MDIDLESNSSYHANPTRWTTYLSSLPLINQSSFFYKDETLGDTYIVFKVHRYADVRCNYTKECLLKFNSYDQFLDTITESNNFVTVEVDGKEYDLYINALSDGYEVYNTETGKYVGYACENDKESIIEEIREMLQ